MKWAVACLCIRGWCSFPLGLNWLVSYVSYEVHCEKSHFSYLSPHKARNESFKIMFLAWPSNLASMSDLPGVSEIIFFRKPHKWKNKELDDENDTKFSNSKRPTDRSNYKIHNCTLMCRSILAASFFSFWNFSAKSFVIFFCEIALLNFVLVKEMAAGRMF